MKGTCNGCKALDRDSCSLGYKTKRLPHWEVVSFGRYLERRF